MIASRVVGRKDTKRSLPHRNGLPFLLSFGERESPSKRAEAGCGSLDGVAASGGSGHFDWEERRDALWLLGLVSSFAMGGFQDVALVIGLILPIISLVPQLRRRGEQKKPLRTLSGRALERRRGVFFRAPGGEPWEIRSTLPRLKVMQKP